MNEHGDMGCEKFADVAAELALGVLTGRERAEALAHLERCDACRETVRQFALTGEQLLELLPAVEPPAGFESRVLARLGIAVPDAPPSASAPAAGQAGPGQTDPMQAGPMQAGPGQTDPMQAGPMQAGPARSDLGQADLGQADPGHEPAGPLSRRRRARRAVKASPPGRARTAGRPGPGRGPGRRTLATLATALAVVVAALGGWGLHGIISPTPQPSMTSAALLSVTHRSVGQIYYYKSGPRWIYMSVDMPSGNGMVTCELAGPDGHYTTVGEFRLTNGYGAWGSPARWSSGELTGARLLAPDGKVLATAAFS
jgi:hypothetical protein